jgi:hypothetical protein
LLDGDACPGDAAALGQTFEDGDHLRFGEGHVQRHSPVHGSMGRSQDPHRRVGGFSRGGVIGEPFLVEMIGPNGTSVSRV